MKSKTLLLTLACSAFVLSACVPLDKFFTPSNTGQTSVSANSDILGTMITIDKNEMALTQEARKEAGTQTVRHLTGYLFAEHRKNLHRAVGVSRDIGITPSMGKEATTWSHQGTQELATLNALSGAAYDKAVVNALVKDYEAAIEAVDTSIKSSTSTKLNDYLYATRKQWVAYLNKAKAAQRKL